MCYIFTDLNPNKNFIALLYLPDPGSTWKQRAGGDPLGDNRGTHAPRSLLAPSPQYRCPCPPSLLKTKEQLPSGNSKSPSGSLIREKNCRAWIPHRDFISCVDHSLRKAPPDPQLCPYRDEHTHTLSLSLTTIYKIDTNKDLLYSTRNSTQYSNDIYGKKIWKWEAILYAYVVCMTESLCYTTETNITLYISSTPIKIFKKKISLQEPEDSILETTEEEPIEGTRSPLPPGYGTWLWPHGPHTWVPIFSPDLSFEGTLRHCGL